MSAVRLGRTFDLVTSFGNALSYAITDDDVARTMDTYAAHHGGTLVVDALNAELPRRRRLPRTHRRQQPPGSATSVALHVRTAARGFSSAPESGESRAGRGPREYRLLYLEEIERGLDAAGFTMLAPSTTASSGRRTFAAPAGASDPGGMGGRKLYAFAGRRP
jgi:hypothetical protein